MITLQVQSWFHNRKQSYPLMDASSPNSLEKLSVAPEGPLNKVYKSPQVSNGNLIFGVLSVLRDMILIQGLWLFKLELLDRFSKA